MCTRVRIIYLLVSIIYKIYRGSYRVFIITKNTKLSEKIYTTNITCTNRRKKFIKSSRQLNVIFVFYRIHLFYFR